MSIENKPVDYPAHPTTPDYPYKPGTVSETEQTTPPPLQESTAPPINASQQMGMGTRTSSTGSSMEASTEASIHDEKERVKQKAKEAADQVRQKTTEAIRNAEEQGRAMAEEQKQQVADQVGSIGHALHTSAQHLHEENQRIVAHYLDQAAARFDRVSQNLRDNSVGRLISQVEDFARRQPGVFLGGAVVTGFLLARFLKSSASRHEYDYRSSQSSGYRSRNTGYDSVPTTPDYDYQLATKPEGPEQSSFGSDNDANSASTPVM